MENIKTFGRSRRCHAIIEWDETIEAESIRDIEAGKYKVTESRIEVEDVIQTHENDISEIAESNPVFADEDWVGDFDFEQLRAMIVTNTKVDWDMQDAAEEFQAILNFIDNKTEEDS
jgi:hypothetical protein